MIERKCLDPNILEMISNILGDTNKGLTGSEIHRLLLQAKIEDISEKDEFLSKRKRLFNAFANFQNTNKCSNNILNFISLVLKPSRFVNKEDEFNSLRTAINQQLAFAGYELKEDGQYRAIEKANTISDVQIKVENLKQELESRKTHSEIFKYCKSELLQNNYFQRIRDLSNLQKDGINFIEEVFSQNPILIINNYQTNSERNEHTGFCNLLKGLCGMFRNTIAHEPKIEWEIKEQDALEILSIISYCHRRLDNAQKIR